MRTILPAILLASCCVSSTTADEEPKFGGKTVDQWVAVLRNQETPKRDRLTAILSLGCLGSKTAVPSLIEEARQGPFANEAVDSLVEIGEGTEVTVPNLIQRFVKEGCERLTYTGTIFFNPHVRDSLVRIGPPAIPALREILEGPNREMRVCAAEVLGDIGPEARAAIPALLRAIEDPSKEREAHALHRIAIQALGKIGPEAKEVLPALNRLLIDKEGRVDREVMTALTNIGAPPVQKLIDLYRRDPETADYLLMRLGPKAHEAVPLLRAALVDKRQQVRVGAATALAHIEPTVVEALPVLIEALKLPIDNDLDLRQVSDALVIYGPPARKAIPLLIEIVKKGFAEEDVLDALVQLDPEGKECVPALIIALKNEDYIYVDKAARCLGLLGPKARDAVPALAELVTRNFGEVFSNERDPQVSAAKALRRIGPAARSAIPALIAALKYRHKVGEDVDCNAAAAAAQVLGSFGADAKSAVPALIEAVQTRGKDEENSFVVAASILALGQIGPDARSAIPTLRGLLMENGKDSIYTLELLIALAQLSPEDKAIAEKRVEKPIGIGFGLSLAVAGRARFLGAMGQRTPESDWSTRKSLERLDRMIANSRGQGSEFLEGWFELLGILGRSASLAIPRLNELRNDPDPWIRMWAAETCQEIMSPDSR